MLHILCVRTQELFTFLHRALALEASTEDYGRMDMAGFRVGKKKIHTASMDGRLEYLALYGRQARKQASKKGLSLQ